MGNTQESDIQKLDPRLKHVDLHSSNSHSHVVTRFPEWDGFLKLLVNICDNISVTLIANEIKTNNWEFYCLIILHLYFPFTCLCCVRVWIFLHFDTLGEQRPSYPRSRVQVKRMNVSCGCLSPANLQAVPWLSQAMQAESLLQMVDVSLPC